MIDEFWAVSALGLCLNIVISDPENNEVANDFAIPVDLIRCCGIIMVLLLHAANEYYTTILLSPLESGFYWWTSTVYKSLTLPCVPLFVMLSGALLLQPSKLNEPIRVFFKKRFNRLGAAFVFWSFVYLAWAFFTSSTPVTFYNFVEGTLFSFFSGSYYHFWFIYIIVGLYLITPILRAIVQCDSQKIIKYLVTLWFIGVALVPVVQLVTGYALNEGLFVMGGTIGYFVLGIYLQRVKVRSSFLYGLFFASVFFTIICTWLMRFHFYSIGQKYFFFDYLSVNVILASVTLFMILCKFPPDWPGGKHPVIRRVTHAISQNTLSIYLFHLIIMETLQRGYLGFQLSLTTINPVIGVPIITTFTLFITLGLILIMKKIPILKTLIG
ncbi:MAG: acyltransferase family protein [Candidatus Bathyarchaeota archaeon]|nr:acyltransferase family protein [Candidatus Bathyarchaeum tardum]